MHIPESVEFAHGRSSSTARQSGPRAGSGRTPLVSCNLPWTPLAGTASPHARTTSTPPDDHRSTNPCKRARRSDARARVVIARPNQLDDAHRPRHPAPPAPPARATRATRTPTPPAPPTRHPPSRREARSPSVTIGHHRSPSVTTDRPSAVVTLPQSGGRRGRREGASHTATLSGGTSASTPTSSMYCTRSAIDVRTRPCSSQKGRSSGILAIEPSSLHTWWSGVGRGVGRGARARARARVAARPSPSHTPRQARRSCAGRQGA